MPETFEAYAEIVALRIELVEQGTILDALLRHGTSEAREQILKDFKDDPILLEVYRLVDGNRNAGQILTELQRLNVPIASQPTVSRKLAKLSQGLGLIAIHHSSKAGNVYHRTRLDRALGISRELAKPAGKKRRA